MEFVVKGGRAGRQRTGCIVVGVYEGGKLSPSATEVDAASGHALAEALNRGDLDGELGSTLLLTRVPDAAADRVLLVGLGAEPDFIESSYLAAVCAATRALGTTGATEATFCLHEVPVNGRDSAWRIEQTVLAIKDALYRFDALKSEPPKNRRALQKVGLHIGDRAETAAAEAALARGVAIAEGIALARDLGNLPGNVCTPAYLAGQALELGRQHGFEVTVFERHDIEQLRMNAFLAVAAGSREPPKLVVMEYRGGAGDAPPVVLVGKGITFDSGGINIKSDLEMEQMKFDMCGAASVLGALRACALMKLPLNVVGIVPAAENMPDGNAIRPGDVVRTMSGLTVEVIDTDSEGRVVLADALTYAERFEPAVLVDVATLTGAIVSALGDVATGVFSNDESLVREIVEAGERAWDRAWHMPMWHEYQETFKSDVADFANVGPQGDCAITAACFLSRFARRYRWAHLDIAGTASKSGEDKGATGRPVALLAHFLARRAAA